MRALIVAALAFSAVARGQTLSIEWENQTTALTEGSGDCGNSHTITWSTNLPLTATACSDLLIWLTAGTCGSAPDAGDLDAGDLPPGVWHPAGSASGTGSSTFTTSYLATLAPICTSDQLDQKFNVCAEFQYAAYLTSCVPSNATGATFSNYSPIATYEYDALPPAAPSIDSVSSGDQSLTVSVSDSDSTTQQILVQYQPTGDGGSGVGAFNTASGSISGSSGSLVISGLTNLVTYNLRAFAQDEVGNQSPASVVVQGTPIPTLGFFDEYKADGGQEQGGCTAAAGLVPLLGLLAALTLGLRRRR